MSRSSRPLYTAPGRPTKPPGKALSATGVTHPTYGRPAVHSVSGGYAMHGTTTGQNSYTIEHRAASKPTLEYKWDSSMITLAKEIPDFDRWMKTKGGFKDAVLSVNDKLFELKQTARGQHTDYGQSREWQTKEEKYHKEITQLTEQVQMLQSQSRASYNDKGHVGSSKYEKELDRLRQENEKIKSQLQSAKTEKDQLLYRLSKLAGAKLSDNNPEITDLSDPNRPQKLSQIYNELYDNAWMEAIDSMPKTNDKGNIHVLLSIFVEIWKFCENLGKHQLTAMENIMLQPWQTSHTHPLGSSENRYHIELMKSIKDARKIAAIETRKRLFKQFLQENPQYGTHNEKVRQYAEACINLCWLCAIQDPPIEFIYNVKEGEKIDSGYFKPYERSGKTVEYLVWPAMLLHKSGPVLTYGVVQVVKGKK
ncbi:uncharacterized protein LOC110454830 [Mizuhopecten yessoensis]|uniref:Mitochondria-eating protein n=1 Tax=Mizuhopecten yessoensis TaxID=6573 RepID=A0A210QE97_MIZYE|nr:uncharacterized protein LOC110454830 [Mizuhopecten yessoensis]OWF47087.1 hypothetical protein KP79_PYT12574 [Mizuhopecten yessoensis]